MVAPRYALLNDDVLAEYRESGDDPEFWARRWRATDLPAYFAPYRAGRLQPFTGLFERRLPKGRPVLEAGCGRGQYVVALRARGYDAYGIEYAEETVDAVRAVEPRLQIE
jgi:SAM-dependent methyltransferase